MKSWLPDMLICPQCIDAKIPLILEENTTVGDDILSGKMVCKRCRADYPIESGVAIVLPLQTREILARADGYNTPGMLSAYLWSHYADLLDDPLATTAYDTWSADLSPTDGDGIDIGCSVGRLTIEMAATHRRVVGLDTSLPFIQKAREIVNSKQLAFDLIIEGHLSEPRHYTFDSPYDFTNVDFIVADALALPFRRERFSTAAAVNLLEKVPDPMTHLKEVNRVLRKADGAFLFSDPFSWDTAVSSPDRWLSGNKGPYSARGIDTMRRIFAGEFGVFDPPLDLIAGSDVPWKIRKTENLWEHINSQYLMGRRRSGKDAS